MKNKVNNNTNRNCFALTGIVLQFRTFSDTNWKHTQKTTPFLQHGSINKKTKNNHDMKNKQSKIKVHPAAIRLLTDATWDFAHAILWSDHPFSKAETELSKLFIKEYYEEIPAEQFVETAHKYFSAYCERILLAKEYVSRFSHRYIPHPCIWLNKENPKGFAGTKAWYLRNLQRRKQMQLCENCGDHMNPILNHFHFCA